MRQEVFPECSIKYKNIHNIQENTYVGWIENSQNQFSNSLENKKIGTMKRKQVECLKTQE